MEQMLMLMVAAGATRLPVANKGDATSPLNYRPIAFTVPSWSLVLDRMPLFLMLTLVGHK